MGNNINFDKTGYIELLKKEKFLKDEGTSLLNENREEGLGSSSFGRLTSSPISELACFTCTLRSPSRG